jgi:hypothetical protein
MNEMKYKNLLNSNGLKLLDTMGITKDRILEQVEMFKKGAHPLKLVKAAAIGVGIVRFTREEKDALISLFDNKSRDFKVIKFVPASGAATRMFSVLLKFNTQLGEIDETEVRERAKAKETDYPALLEVIEGLKEKRFAFHADLKKALASDGFDMEALIKEGRFKTIIEYLLTSKGLDYAAIPKGLIKFHQYDDGNYSRTAFEEHLEEGTTYSKDCKDTVHIHFTVSPEFRQRIMEHIGESILKDRKENIAFEIGYSEQKSSTDTPAVDEDNNLFRDDEGKLVLRPGGHGALIENLNDLDYDIVFIKNIDNVVPERLRAETTRSKKMLGGYLLKLQSMIFSFLDRLTKGDAAAEEIDEMIAYSKETLNIGFPNDFFERTLLERQHFLFEKLNRPQRVCGMVINEGEPGGGPFWVEGQDGTISLQIVEGVQIDKKSKSQKEILNTSTHFNPVDLVCGIRDFRGNKFDLHKYIDRDAFFVSHKSWKDGRRLKALELPGLWNGAMADWITVFVEVPIITFNPIKTINDLLRKEHL